MKKIILLLMLLVLQTAYSKIESIEHFVEGEPHKNCKPGDKGCVINVDSIHYFGKSKNFFLKKDYKIPVGSLKDTLINIAKKEGFDVHWNLASDYVIPHSYVERNKTIPELFSIMTENLPIFTMFYIKNRMITVRPMYDKRESDTSDKYAIDSRK